MESSEPNWLSTRDVLERYGFALTQANLDPQGGCYLRNKLTGDSCPLRLWFKEDVEEKVPAWVAEAGQKATRDRITSGYDKDRKQRAEAWQKARLGS
jgi:hypothetical protein